GGGAHLTLDVAARDLATTAAGENHFYFLDHVILRVVLVSRRQIGVGATARRVSRSRAPHHRSAQPSSLRAIDGIWLACARIAAPACIRICRRLRFETS